MSTAEVPIDDSYANPRGGNNDVVPVVKDSAAVESGVQGGSEDSDATLQRDDTEAIDQNNIIDGDRTRGASKPEGSYAEPGDEEGLPENDGTSAVAQ